jgi:periplasmic mercuric ion binding protein
MKTLQLFLLSFVFLSFSHIATAQEKTDTLKVSGNCGMCKKKIETAAKTAGASFAQWNADSKMLVVKYNSTTANAAKIQQSIAKTGYDTQDVKATDEAYNNLHECCQYNRTAAVADCCKDGQCEAGAACCKDKSCCADGKCTKHEHDATQAGASKPSCCKKA